MAGLTRDLTRTQFFDGICRDNSEVVLRAIRELPLQFRLTMGSSEGFLHDLREKRFTCYEHIFLTPDLSRGLDRIKISHGTLLRVSDPPGTRQTDVGLVSRTGRNPVPAVG